MLSVFFSLMLMLLILRIMFLTSSTYLKVLAENQYGYTEKTNDINYKLLDKNGIDIIKYKASYYFVVDKKNFQQYNQEENMEKLLTVKYILKGYNDDYDITKIFEEPGYKKYFEIDKKTYDKLNEIELLQGTYCFEKKSIDKENDYSIENMLMNPLYEDNGTKKLKSGIEGLIFEITKDNEYDYLKFYPDENGNYKVKERSSLEKNSNIMLTIDEKFQTEIHQYLKEYNDDKCKNLSAMLMESETGKILSMTQDNYLLENRNIGLGTYGGFYPGSIFKIIVEAIAFDKNLVSRDEKFKCESRYEDYTSYHDELTIDEALKKSCNDVFVQIGHRIGKDMKNYLYKLHLNEKLLDMQDEVGGEMLFNDENLDNGDITLLSFGQNIRITPIEAISMANTIVNEGIFVKPSILEGITNSKGDLVKKWKTTTEKVFSKISSKLVKKDMENVLDNENLKDFKIPGYVMGGKTGTSERVESQVKVYDGWFIGYITIDERNYTICIFGEELSKDTLGGSVCGPVFNKICNMLIDQANNK